MGGGDAVYVADLKGKLEKAGLDECVEWYPDLDRTEKVKFLQSLAVFSVPATSPEAFGLYLIEAMACGVPLTAFANTGQLDIVDHKVNGYLAENLSSEDLARGIAWCLDEGSKDGGLSLRARAKALRSFDMRSVVLQHVALYSRLLGQRVPGSINGRKAAAEPELGAEAANWPLIPQPPSANRQGELS